MKTSSRLGTRLLCGAAAAAILASAGAAQAEERPVRFEIPAQPLTAALNEFGIQSGSAVLFKADVTGARLSRPLSGAVEPEMALTAMLDGTGLSYRREGDAFVIVQGGSDAPQSGSAAGAGAEVEALIVTAQKREENIQDVPIAISAFTAQDLEQQKIEGGFDLLKAIPNVTFSKNNFTSYNFSIRGVGTKAVSATTDPGVAVSFNNTGVLQNRLFEQEYYDLERVEVLRGPQGTLYGRNATSGVINVISAKPDLNDIDAYAKVEVGNYEARRAQGMVNLPLIEDKLAVRLSGALTQRQGYDYNLTTRNDVNGRDLWSTRLTVGFEPIEAFRGNLIWEHFDENDNRSRTGKQLCHRDPGPEMIGDNVVAAGVNSLMPGYIRQAVFAQGCKAGSLYDDAAFGTPNGTSVNFILGALFTRGAGGALGFDSLNRYVGVINDADPYGGMTQSPNLREIASIRDPVYRANADIIELNLEFDLTDALTFYSQTAYVEDETYSFQDYNRFNTVPVFSDSSVLRRRLDVGDFTGFSPRAEGSPVGSPGVFCDPQIGCSSSIAGFDIAQASAEQFTQEFRLQSNFDGPVNFSMGGNYTKFDTLIDYYVMFNLLTAIASAPLFDDDPDPAICGSGFAWDSAYRVPADYIYAACPYVDPNPLDTSRNFEGDGHNYFRSKNPYELESWAVFGETYWNLREDLKLTAGLRYTDDTKTFTQVPSQVLLASGFLGGGTVARGYPVAGEIEQNWGEWTGRLVVDWKPELSFTDDTLLYGSIAHGYKGGGANPPRPGFASVEYLEEFVVGGGIVDQATFDFYRELRAFPVLELTADEYEDTFEPEFVNAFEVGAKNTLLDGAMTFNVTGFYYDYKDYQVSQIRDRTAVNENFDAKVWGIEFETMFAPSRNFQLIANLGYLDTEIADGETSIDIMNRNQSNPDYVVVKPWAQLPSNCVVPFHIAEYWVEHNTNINNYWQMCAGLGGYFVLATEPTVIDINTGQPYTPLARDAEGNLIYPELNGGAGLSDDLGGNELPNAPHWTANVGAQYGMDLMAGWRGTLRGDVYWQSQSWHRVYNSDPYDKLHGWWNANLSLWFEHADLGLKVEVYAKNILDDTPITDAFLNSDDTALTTNVFTLDPRLIGLSIRKDF